MKNKSIKKKKSFKYIESNIPNINFYHCHKIDSKYLFNKFNKYFTKINDIFLNIDLNKKSISIDNIKKNALNIRIEDFNETDEDIYFKKINYHSRLNIYNNIWSCDNYIYTTTHLINLACYYYNKTAIQTYEKASLDETKFFSNLIIKIYTYILYNYTLKFISYEKNKNNEYIFNEELYKKYIKLSIPYIYYLYKFYYNGEILFLFNEYHMILRVFDEINNHIENISNSEQINKIDIIDNNLYKTLLNLYISDKDYYKELDLLILSSTLLEKKLTMFYHIKENIGLYNIIFNALYKENIDKLQLEGFYCYLILSSLFYFIITKNNKISKEQFLEAYEPLEHIETEFNKKILNIYNINELFDE